MPCRHRHCNILSPSIKPCCHNHGSRHSIGIQFSGVPSASTSRCPSSMRSYDTSDEDFCTSDTCGNIDTYVKPQPEYCPFGLKKQVSKGQQKNIAVEASESQLRIYSDIPGSVHVLVKDAATSPKVSFQVVSNLQALELKLPNPNEEHVTDTTKLQSDVKENVKILKDTSTQVDASEDTNPSNHPNPVNSESKTCCNAIKKRNSEPVIPAHNSSLLKEKHSPQHINRKKSIESSCPTCSTGTCSKKKSSKCQCKYPPTMDHLGCTGKLVGNCNCGN